MQASQVRRLEALFPGRASFSRRERSMYSHDVGALPGLIKPLLGGTQPAGVVQPESEEELAELVRWAAVERVPLVPRGKSTSGYGGVLPVQGGLVVDFARMAAIVSVQGDLVTVEPGISWRKLDQALAAQGLTLCLYPSSYPSSTLGGWLAAAGDMNLRGRQGVVATGELLSGADIDVRSCRGEVTVAGMLKAAEEVEIHSGSHVSIEIAVASGNDITIWAKDTVSVCAELTAGDDISIWAGESISISGDLNSAEDVFLWAGETLWIYGDIAGGDDVKAWAGCAVWAYGDITAEDDLYIFGGCSVEISGTVKAGDHLWIRSPRACCRCCQKKTGRC